MIIKKLSIDHIYVYTLTLVGIIFGILSTDNKGQIKQASKKILSMKRFMFLSAFILMFLTGYTVMAQDVVPEKLNLPGDNLNLFAVMKLFQESETLEGFEKNLNAEDSKINNLDLNGDDKVDYIKVIDYPNGNDHTIVLQVAVNEKENQDVAVFTVSKDADNNVVIQLIGDEALYGKDYIIEPNYADNGQVTETPNPGYNPGTNARGKNVVVKRTTYVEVSAWPLIRFMFMPSYIAWHSPWYWGYYPSYWSPWHPYYWDYYNGYQSHWNNYYYRHYRPWHAYRDAHWNDYYYKSHRSYSNTVYQRRDNGSYRNTYSRPDTRQQGSADYLKRYPSNHNRSGNQDNMNQTGRRQNSHQDVNRSTGSQNDNRNVARPGNNRPMEGQGLNKPATRNNTKRSPAVNTRSERQSKNTPSVRSENKRTSAPRQEKVKRTARPQKSEIKTVKRTERKSENKTERRK